MNFVLSTPIRLFTVDAERPDSPRPEKPTQPRPPPSQAPRRPQEDPAKRSFEGPPLPPSSPTVPEVGDPPQEQPQMPAPSRRG